MGTVLTSPVIVGGDPITVSDLGGDCPGRAERRSRTGARRARHLCGNVATKLRCPLLCKVKMSLGSF
jgi:hypothetical protein